MTTREQVYIWNNEQGNPAPKGQGNDITSNISRRMTEEQWKEYRLLCEKMEQEEIDYFNNKHKFQTS